MATRTLQHEIGKKRPFADPSHEAYLNLLRTAAVLSQPFQRLFKAHALSEATYNALRILRGSRQTSGSPYHGRTCSEVGDELIAQVPDVTRLIDRLETQGLVERRRCEQDRRVVYVDITKQGLALLTQLDAEVERIHRGQLAHMTKAELAEISRLLYKARHPEEPH